MSADPYASPPLPPSPLPARGPVARGPHTAPGDYVFPTNGFDLDEDIVSGHFSLKLFGLGGDSRIRGYWRNYYDDVHGIVFVIDSADTARLAEVKAAFREMAADHRVSGKPILLYANKQDLPGALTEAEIAQAIGLADLSTSPHHIIKCVYVHTRAMALLGGGGPSQRHSLRPVLSAVHCALIIPVLLSSAPLIARPPPQCIG
jgi:GTPase SAR1 family protein